MADAEHPTMRVSTYPFTMFGGRWAEQTLDIVTAMPSRGDTVVGNDVLFGYQTTVMPGVRIGDGSIIAAGAVVTADVPPYTIVGGNPARPIRQHFTDADTERLLRAAWWDWPADLVIEHARTIMTGAPAVLMRAYIQSRQHLPYASSRNSQWLFPGRQPGQPMNPVSLQVHLREIGVPPQRGRTSAIRQLVLQAPAPVIVKALGYHDKVCHQRQPARTATRLGTEAGGTWSRYAPGDHQR